MKIFCNPLNTSYPFSFIRALDEGKVSGFFHSREAADPSLVCFKGKYYLFASMTASVWISEDLCRWEEAPLPDNLPLYGYAPDVQVIGDWLWFCASGTRKTCRFFRTKDPVKGPYEEWKSSFSFADPCLFGDDDGRIYFYWGCTDTGTTWGVQLNPDTMEPIGERQPMIAGNPAEHGFERRGEDHGEPEARPWIEGSWMTKHNGKYYLQYACPGTEFNIYCDGVYVSDKPLGPFVFAENNPFSYKPGGFINGAGHGSTLPDAEGAWWHSSTEVIGVCHEFERRVGLWRAGFDEDGELFCNQRYGDWPVNVDSARQNPWAEPEWMLLSYGKKAIASSFEPGREPEKAVDENSKSFWRSASEKPGEWLSVDLGEEMRVNAAQVNFADAPGSKIPEDGAVEWHTVNACMERSIEGAPMPIRWLLEYSRDGKNWEIFDDKRDGKSNRCHDFAVSEKGVSARFFRLTVDEMPEGVPACVSGLRLFGRGRGQKPEKIRASAKRVSDLDFVVRAEEKQDVSGYQILWGHSPEKLYHSYLVMGKALDKKIGALVKGQRSFVRVDCFNENGITHGEVTKL